MKNEPNRQHQKDAPQDNKHFVLIIVIAVVAVLLIIAATVFALIYFSKNEEKTAPTQADPTTATQAVPSEISTYTLSTEAQPQTQAATEEAFDEIEMDEELETLLSYQGIDEADIKELSTSQIITVSSYGNTCDIDFWEIRGSKWTKDDSLSVSGYVGEMGVTDNMSEYIQATPRGFFPVKEAFYIQTKPETGLDSFPITNDTYWVDDPSSDFYNQRVEGTQYQDWSSAEHMIDYSAYEYGFVIGYNLSCVKGAGSAIFFHISNGPTAGCVGTSYDAVLSYLSALSKSANPYILII